MKVKDAITRLKDAGWKQVRQEGSHRTFKKDGEPNVVTVSGHDRDDVLVGQLSDIRRKSGLSFR